MSFPDLRTFIDQLRRNNDVVYIDAPVNPVEEAAEIHRRVIAANGPALVFRNITGADFPLVTNLFGTAQRAELAFGERPLRLIKRLVQLVETILPPTPAKLWGARDVGLELLKVGLKRGKGGPVTEVVTSDVRLDRLPAMTLWPEDGGPFVTLPLVFTQHPDGRGHNLGMYRLHVHGPTHTGMHWQIGKGGGYHYQIAEARNEALPVTVFLGGPPALILSAIVPLPENLPELMLASLISGERLKLSDGPWPHALVSNAEFALIGEVPPHVRQPEGPFGDHYGYYSLEHDFPVFRVSKVCHRKDAIWPATIVGKPRQEDFFLGDWLQELLSPLFPLVMPAVRDLWSYGETGYHALSAAVVQERYRREAMASAFRILGEGQLSLTKFLLLLDKPMDLRDFKPVLEHVLARFRPETDLYVFSNLSMDTLDYAGPAINEGSKGVMMGVGEPVRELPRAFRGELPAGVRDARVYCGGCLVVEGPAYTAEPGAADRLASAFPGWPMLVLVDNAAEATRTDSRFLWTAFTRMEPAADLHGSRRIQRNHLVFEGSVLLDARVKPTYPGELFCDPDTAALVGRRWGEYFPSGKVEMGDSDVGHLDR